MSKKSSYFTAMIGMAIFLLASLYMYLFNENSNQMNILLIGAMIILFIGMIAFTVKFLSSKKIVTTE